jgi:hypothetical protein
MREDVRNRAGSVPNGAILLVGWSILRLLFWAAVAAIRLSLRFIIGVVAWSVGAYVGYRLVRTRSRE